MSTLAQEARAAAVEAERLARQLATRNHDMSEKRQAAFRANRSDQGDRLRQERVEAQQVLDEVVVNLASTLQDLWEAFSAYKVADHLLSSFAGTRNDREATFAAVLERSVGARMMGAYRVEEAALAAADAASEEHIERLYEGIDKRKDNLAGRG